MHVVRGLPLCLYCHACAWASQRIQIATPLVINLTTRIGDGSLTHAYLLTECHNWLHYSTELVYNNPNLLGLDGGAPPFQPHVERSILEKLGGKSDAPLSWTPWNSVISFARAYLVDAHTHVIHLLHVLWGVWVVALLEPSSESGTQGGSPLILMSKEPTRSNMAPRTLFGFWVFFNSKI